MLKIKFKFPKNMNIQSRSKSILATPNLEANTARSYVGSTFSNAKSVVPVMPITAREPIITRDYSKSAIPTRGFLLIGLFYIGKSKGIELDKEKQHVKDLSELISKIDNLAEELRAKKKIIAELEGEKSHLLNFKEQYMVMKTDSEKSRADFRKSEQENEKLKQELSQISQKRQNELEKLKKHIEDMENRFNNEKEAHKNEENRLRETILNIEQKNKSLVDALNEAHMEKERFESINSEQIIGYQNTKKKLFETIENSKKKEELQNQEISSLRKTIEDIELLKKDLEKKLEAYMKEANYFKESFDNEKIKSTDLENKLQNTEKELFAEIEKNKEISKENEGIKTENTKSQDLLLKQTKLINMMRETVKDDKIIIARQEDDLAHLTDLVNELKREKNDLLKRLDNESMRASEYKRNTDDLEVQKHELEQQVRELREEAIRLNSEIAAFSNAKQELTNARMKELDLLSKAISNAYGEQNSISNK